MANDAEVAVANESDKAKANVADKADEADEADAYYWSNLRVTSILLVAT